MSRPPEDGTHDPVLDAAWRALPLDEPPRGLDDAIRAAAHRAVQARPGSVKARAPLPAWMALAAAASIGVIAIGVWQMQPQDIDPVHAPASDMPAPSSVKDRVTTAVAPEARLRVQQDAQVAAGNAVTPVAPAAPTVAPPPAFAPPPVVLAQSAAPAARKQDSAMANVPMTGARPEVGRVAEATAPARTSEPRGNAKPQPLPSASAPAERAEATDKLLARAPSPFPGDAPSSLASAKRERPADAETARGGAAADSADQARLRDRADATPPAMAAAPAQSGGLAKSVVRSFDDYVLAIRRARQEQRDDDAVRELTALRTAYPDADERLPADLKAWAARPR